MPGAKIDGVFLRSIPSTNVPFGNLSAGDIIYVAIGSRSNDNNDSTSITYQIVPEPASLPIFGAGFLTLLARRRRV